MDDATVSLILRKEVLEACGYRVLTAENGPEALKIFSSQPVDLVILDYKLPEMNGDVLAGRMKDLRPSVPILMFSGYVDLPRAALAHVNRCLTKGEGPQLLLQAVAELMAQARNSTAVPGS